VIPATPGQVRTQAEARQLVRSLTMHVACPL